MSEMKFKTSMMCDGCVAKVGPSLDQLEGIDEWKVDLTSADKLLTVNTDKLAAEDIMNAVRSTGYKIMLIS